MYSHLIIGSVHLNSFGIVGKRAVRWVARAGQSQTVRPQSAGMVEHTEVPGRLRTVRLQPLRSCQLGKVALIARSIRSWHSLALDAVFHPELILANCQELVSGAAVARLACVVLFLTLGSSPTSGQSLPAPPTPAQNLGLNINQSYHGDQENINLATGNVELELPLLNLPGRNGHDLNISLSYNSQFWSIFPSVSMVVNSQGQQGTETFWHWVHGTEHPLPMMPPGWSGLGSQPSVMSDVNVQVDQATDGSGHPVHQFCTTNYRVLMPDGSLHHFPGIKTNCYSDGSYPFTYTNILVGDTDFKDPLWLRYDVNNGLYASNGNRWAGPNFEDTNGNLITTSGSQQLTADTDTLGRNFQLSYSSAVSPPSAATYKDSNGVTQTITLNYLPDGSFTTTGSFSNPPPVASTNQPNTYAMAAMTCSTSNPCAWGPMLSSIVLPNGLTYTFHYNSTFGELDQITYPSGGYTRYEYATFQRGIPSDMQGPETPMGPWDFREVVAKHVCRASVVPLGALSYTAVGSVPSNTCPVPEDTTIHSPTISVNSVNNASTSVTDPFGNVTVFQFCFGAPGDSCGSNPYETKRQIYDNAGHLLRTIDTTYTGSAFHKASETITLDNGLVTKTEWDYQIAQRLYSEPGPPGVTFVPLTVSDATGNVTEKREFAYGQGAPGPLVRKTDDAWGYGTPGAAFNNRKTSDTVSDGSGNVTAQTALEYDNYTQPIAASGATQHDSAYGTNYGTRGNVTAIKRWRNTDGSWLTTRYQYDDAGNVISTTDPLGNTTSFSYADSWGDATCKPSQGTASAYRTSTTNALKQQASAGYNSCTGTVASTKDLNGNQTTHTYDMLSRPLVTTLADLGQTTLCYSEVSGSTCASSGNPIHVVSTKKINSSLSLVTTAVLDGLGRVNQAQLNSDPSGTDYTDTTYDSLGRVSTVSNPYRTTSDPTYGVTQMTYDAVGRVTQTTKQDGSVTTTQYDQTSANSANGNCTTTTDEAGKPRKSCTDSLGRLIEVDEPQASTGSMSTPYITLYSYDVLDNLLSVNQEGDGGQAARVRTFTYDSISRLLTATNPESGQITYGYDADGNLLTKTSPAPNQSGAGTVTTAYVYDALNRLTQKSYSDGATPTVFFRYDTASNWGNPSVTQTNLIGRVSLIYENGTTTTGNQVFSYDPMGRVVANNQCLPSNCGAGNYPLSATYDLAGNLTSVTYPSGRLVTYGHNAGNLLDQVQFTKWNGVAPSGGVFNYWVAADNNFYPNGVPKAWTFGNGVTESTTLNKRLQLLEETVSNPAIYTFADHLYNYGSQNNGNILSVSDQLNPSRTQSFTYDALNRLSTAGEGRWGLGFVHDAWGNRLQQNVTAGTAESFQITVDAKNHIQGAPSGCTAGSRYCYDGAGNLLHDNLDHQYVYDAENRITQVDGGAAIYTYTADGSRVRKDVSGSPSTEYLYFNGNVIAERNVSTGDWTDYIWANGKRVAKAMPFDNGLRIYGTRCGSCGAQYSLFYLNVAGPAGYTIRSGDKLDLTQYQVTGSHGGIVLAFTDGTNTNWNLRDQDTYFANDDGTQNTTHVRRMDLGGFVGKTIQQIALDQENDTAAGSFAIIYEQAVLTSSDGTVQPIYTGESTSQVSSIVATSGVTGTASHIDVNEGKGIYPTTTTTYYHTDQINSSALVTAGSGWPVWQATYLPYGEEYNPQIGTEHYKFGGHERDNETGLDYMLARYYSNPLGRFLTPDWGSMSEPLPFAGLRDPQSLNLYGYAGNNPLRFADPDGHDYHVCGLNGKDCADYTDDQYNQWLKDHPNVRQSPGGTLESCDENGCQKIGSAIYFNRKDQEGAAMIGIGGPKFIYAFMKEAVKTAVIGGVVGQVLKGVSEGLSLADEAGSVGLPTGWPGPGSGPQVVNGITYTEHALERMAPVGLGGRGVPPSVVENAIKAGTAAAGKYPGTVEHVFENVTVITNTAGDKVITVIKTGH